MHSATGYLFQLTGLAQFLETQNLKLQLVLQVSKHELWITQMSGLGVILVVSAILICSTPLTFYGLLYLVVIFFNSHMQTERIHLQILTQAILKVK